VPVRKRREDLSPPHPRFELYRRLLLVAAVPLVVLGLWTEMTILVPIASLLLGAG